jgi:hypothetical protein
MRPYLYSGSGVDDVIAPLRSSAVAVRTRPTLVAFGEIRALGTGETGTCLVTLEGGREGGSQFLNISARTMSIHNR